MALSDLIATPGEAAAGALAREWKMNDPDVLVRVRELVDAAVDAEREACANLAETAPGDFERDTAGRTEGAVRAGIAGSIRMRSNAL